MKTKLTDVDVKKLCGALVYGLGDVERVGKGVEVYTQRRELGTGKTPLGKAVTLTIGG